MPKILPPVAGANASAPAAAAPSSRIAPGKSDRSNAFDEVLSGARRRNKPTSAERDPAQPAPASSTPVKPKQRAAKREAASEESEAPEPSARPESNGDLSSSPEGASEVTDDATTTTAADQPVEAVDEADHDETVDVSQTPAAKGDSFDAQLALQVAQ